MPVDPFTISALIAAGSSLVSGLMSNNAAKNAQLRSIDAQRGMQMMLMNGGAQMARNAKQAGLSPAFALGQSSTPVASSPPANSMPFDFSSLADIASKKEMMSLQKEQAKVAKAEERKSSAEASIAEEKAKQEKINTLDMQGKRRAFVDQTPYTDENGLVVKTTPYSGEYGVAQGELEKLKMSLDKFGIDVNRLNLELDKAVKERQKSDDAILDAMAHLPKDTQDNIRAQASQFLSAVRVNDADVALKTAQTLYTDIQREFVELQKREFASGSVDELFSNLSFENFFKWLLKQVTQMVRGSISIHN